MKAVSALNAYWNRSSLCSTNTPVNNDPPQYSAASAKNWWGAWGMFYKSMLNSPESTCSPMANTAPLLFLLEREVLPKIREDYSVNPASKYFGIIESAFGRSATELAKILRVTRPMIYHYRRGMEPNADNFKRIKLLGTLVNEVGSDVRPMLRGALKWELPEGRTLMDMLSDEAVDSLALRAILQRITADIARRQKLAMMLSTRIKKKDNTAIMESRHKAGKPIYVSDPQVAGQLIQIRPDGTRVPGRMVNRKFVPNEE